MGFFSLLIVRFLGFYIEYLVHVLLLVFIYQYWSSKRDLFHPLWAPVLYVHLSSGHRLCNGPCHIKGWKVCCNVHSNNTGNMYMYDRIAVFTMWQKCWFESDKEKKTSLFSDWSPIFWYCRWYIYVPLFIHIDLWTFQEWNNN